MQQVTPKRNLAVLIYTIRKDKGLSRKSAKSNLTLERGILQDE
jgi:hypothetical protein